MATSEPLADTLATELRTRTAQTLALESGGSEDHDRSTARPGLRFGRYLVINEVGSGAMGVVYAAYDPKLDRKVALKQLTTRGTITARQRLEREAQALARLAHPNVVAVYDVDVHEQQLYVAMEFVKGQTLGAWMREATDSGAARPWSEVLEVFMAAGRGLAAAHAAGLIHRDFKPENVMIGADGRVRVMDFGLARPEAEAGAEHRTDSVRNLHIDTNMLETPMTQTGAAVGTPAYMAPEQFMGEADARSDQFGFCVALYEALCGVRPFAGADLHAHLDAIDAGDVAQGPHGAAVPAWLRAVVVRGLASDPEQRWPSLHALLDALADDPAQRRRAWITAGVAGGVLTALVAGLVWMAQPQPVDEVCTGFEAKLAGVWGDERRTQVRATLEGTQLSYAADTSTRVAQRLDDYTHSWVIARRDACLATQRGEQSDTLLDLRMRCLDQRLRHVDAAVSVLGEADAEIVSKAVETVTELPSLAGCADTEALTAELPPPTNTAQAERVERLELRLIDAEALKHAGKYHASLEQTEAVLTEAEALGYEPLLVRARLQAGALHTLLTHPEQARTQLRQAYASALGLKMMPEAAIAATQQIGVLGDLLARYDEARRWAFDAEALVRAADSEVLRARYQVELGRLALAEGSYDEGRALLELALTSLDTQLGPEHPYLAYVHDSLGWIESRAGKHAAARVNFERARAINEVALGPDHPLVAANLKNLGTAAWSEGNYDDARVVLERALRSFERSVGVNDIRVARTLISLGLVAKAQAQYDQAEAHYLRVLEIFDAMLEPEHPLRGETLSNLGALALSRGDLPAARDYFERSLALSEKTLGPEHPNLASMLGNLGVLAIEEKDLERAERYLERAAALLEASLGPDHPNVGISMVGLGDLALEHGRDEDALARFERAHEIFVRALGPEHPHLAVTLNGMGEAQRRLGQVVAALASLERALQLGAPLSPTEQASIRYVLARALWSAPVEEGRDRKRARELVEQAASDYAAAGAGFTDELAKVEAWLASPS